ncbi:MAG: sigma-70 family RNA polymerase sigma factor [Verrucomicrobiae bacterium]|nr:sigma-70 family RNA polymerase sigma factor [Verrucomicrobiae bacterium]
MPPDDEAPAPPDGAGPPNGYDFSDTPRLTRALRQGDEAAYHWLHAHWRGRMDRYCLAIANGDAALAGDVAQAVWLRIMRHIRELPSEEALWCWFVRAARHAATDERRTRGRYHRALHRLAAWWRDREPPPVPRTPEHPRAEELDALARVISQLSADERILIESRYFSRESLDALALRLGISTRAVEGRLARLRKHLRQRVAQELKNESRT